MTNRERLVKLVRAEGYLKQTKAAYSPEGPWYKRGMPLLWEVRLSLRGTPEGTLLAEAHGLIKDVEKGYDPTAPRWHAAMRNIDLVEAKLESPAIPNLGRIEVGGKSLLLYQLTHQTAGLHRRTRSYYPAVDFGWTAGEPVYAPEPMVVTAQSSAAGADACYFDGESSLEYWLGHIVKAPPTGRDFDKGDVLGIIAAIAGADHGHFGINAKPLIGRDLLWGRHGNGPDYTYGSPTVGAQLFRALAT